MRTLWILVLIVACATTLSVAKAPAASGVCKVPRGQFTFTATRPA
jgi:hypothetical protein